MSHLPIELVVRDRDVALVGDHPETRRKLPRLLKAGARIAFYDGGAAVEPAPEGVALLPGLPSDAELEGFLVVFVSPLLAEALAAQAEKARAAGRLFCVLDRPELSTFANPAVADVAGIGLRLFGGGAAPGLTRRLREELERVLGEPRFARFVAELASMRRAWPRGERPARTLRALEGFALEGRFRLPSWFADSEPPGEGGPEGADNT